MFSYALTNNDFGPVLMIGFLVLMVGMGIFGYLQAEKRRKAMLALARSLGWSYQPGKDRSIDNRFPTFSCLQQGANRYAYNMMTGQSENGRELLAFDYHYETYSRDSKGRRQTHHHYFSAMILNTGLPLRPLLIRPEGFFDKVTEFFGYDDIDFESNEFSRRFYVKSPDKRWAFDVIHQETMEFLLESPAFTLEFTGPYVMARQKSRFDLAEFCQALAVAEGVLERLPKYLLAEMKGDVR